MSDIQQKLYDYSLVGTTATSSTVLTHCSLNWNEMRYRLAANPEMPRMATNQSREQMNLPSVAA